MTPFECISKDETIHMMINLKLRMNRSWRLAEKLAKAVYTEWLTFNIIMFTLSTKSLMNQMKCVALIILKTLKASMATKATEKGSGPDKALNDIGVVAESSIKKRAFSCKI